MSNAVHNGASRNSGIVSRLLGELNLRVVLAGGVLLLAAGIGLWPAFSTLMEKWSESLGDSSSYSHGFLVAVISGYLLYKVLARSRAAPKKSLTNLFVLIPMLIVWALSYVADVEIGMWLLVPPILAMSFVAVLGWEIAKATFFPLAYLYFAIPFWDYINGFLQSGTVLAVERLLHLLGVSALVQGNRVLISAGTFEIAGGCSGIHFFIVGLALAALYGYLYLGKCSHRLILAGVAIALALITNWIRVAAIIYAGDASGMQHYLVTVDHYNFGWVLFGLSLIPFFIVAGRLRPALPLENTGLRTGATKNRFPAVSWLVVLVTIAILLSPSVLWMQRDTSLISGLSMDLPAVDGWMGPTGAAADWHPIFSEASAEAQGRYVSSGTSVDVYANVYVNQTQGRELVGYGNSVFGHRFTRVLGSESIEISDKDGKSFQARQVILADRQDNRRVVLYWYLIGKTTRLSDDLGAKAYQAAWGLAGNHDAGLIAISSGCEENCAEAKRVVTDFAVAAQDALHMEIQAVGSSAGHEESGGSNSG